MIKSDFISLLIFLTLVSSVECFSQTEEKTDPGFFRCVFYNVENYFDTKEDTLLTYNEFTPEGERHWTYTRYSQKRAKLFKLMMAIGEWNQITLLAFAEIENEFVLNDLIENTPLKNEGYEVIHYESEDDRGIDVGLIYNSDEFIPVLSQPLKIKSEKDTSFNTRDILYVKGLLANDTIHVFINHWPSRYGGLLETRPFRKLAAVVLKRITDSICKTVENANILIMGDFNDNPHDESIVYLTQQQRCKLNVLELLSENKLIEGTMKYQAGWEMFDQIIVSETLKEGFGGLMVKKQCGNIFVAQYLLEEDAKYLGVKPKRTYTGYKYNGGISDHLPVFVDIYNLQ